MKKKPFPWFLITLCLFSILGGGPAAAEGEGPDRSETRHPVLAGIWYPGDRNELSRAVQTYLSSVPFPPLKGSLKALIVPHAGYMYSGKVAAHAYKLLEKSDFQRVFMIGPSHYVRFSGVSVNLQEAYETPLGKVPVDVESAGRLIKTAPQIRWIPQAHRREHSLEIQLPFLQSRLETFRIISVLMGQQDFETCRILAEGLVKIIGGDTRTLLLASTDLSHFHADRRAREMDEEFIGHVRDFDPEGLNRSLSAGKCEACGAGPAIAVMLAARELGARQAVILDAANSGDITGDRSRVVGYCSAALVANRR